MSHSHVIIGENNVNPVIFREYIGMKPYPNPSKFPSKFPSDIVNNKIDEFHIILAFAHDTYNKDGKGSGNFYANWDIDSKDIKDIKDHYPNVKVVFSIGGRDAKYPFSPTENDNWCDNAVNSLKNIIQQYKFDGIDINYVHINTDHEKDFFNYVGDVITRLKKEVGIDVVSIAPSHETHKHYKLLYSAHSDDIDWVNYQFYMQTLPTKDDFVNHFNRLSKEYTPKKFLVGASIINPRDAVNLPWDVFIQGCTDLVKRKSLSGIFIWNANSQRCRFSFQIISIDINIDWKWDLNWE